LGCGKKSQNAEGDNMMVRIWANSREEAQRIAKNLLKDPSVVKVEVKGTRYLIKALAVKKGKMKKLRSVI